MRWRFLIVILVLMSAGTGNVHAQTTSIQNLRSIPSDENTFFVGLRAHAGFLIIHSKSLAPIGNPHPWGAELDFGKQFMTQRAWNGCNCYPRAGVSLTYWNFDQPEVLGWGMTAVAYMEPVFLTRHKFNISLRWGMGVSWQSKPYDEDTNPLNLSYSTSFAFPLAVNLGMYYRFNNQISLRGALNYNHISNGGIKLPNKGLNYPTASLGVDYYLDNVNFEERERIIDRHGPHKLGRLYLGHFSALSQYDPSVPKQYYVMGFWMKYSRSWGKRSAVVAGIEGINDKGRKNEVERWGLGQDHRQLAMLVGHEVWLGKVIFAQELGIYIIDKLKWKDPVYQRYELLYQFHPNFAAGISLKAHRHVANYLDLRVTAMF